jgi:phosphopantothenoylcysteine decarboxylase/phosphopantothenate--cysteine ligase
MQPKKILIKMSGSIAAYKVCQVISKLVQAGHEVQVVTSPHAHHFIGSSTLEGLSQKPVVFDTFAPNHAMAHIHLMRWADIILAAPATANFINKIAAGIGDDLLSTLFLAHDFKKPYLIAPAMNTSMYLHPITQQSLAKLKNFSIEILEAESGVLACGEVGWGRLLEPETLLKKIKEKISKPTKQRKSSRQLEELPQSELKLTPILITSGGTQEPIDSMRVLTNLSTGKTASRLADYLYGLGFQVSVLAAKNSIKPRFREIPIYTYQSFTDLNIKLKSLVSKNEYGAVIHAAAVSDFSVSEISQNSTNLQISQDNKISSDKELIIKLKPNPKLLPQIKAWSKAKDTVVVGFKFTSSENMNERKTAVEKLFKEGAVDFVVHNDNHEINRQKNRHSFNLYNPKGENIHCKSPLELYQNLSVNLFEITFKRELL